MKKTTSLLFALAITLSGCNNDDDNAATTLEGNWRLVQISGGITGNVHNITPGSVVWDFDVSETNITVTNNAPADSSSGLTTGTYEYIQEANQGVCDNFVSVVADDYIIGMGCPTVSSDTLTLNNGYADGEMYTFVR